MPILNRWMCRDLEQLEETKEYVSSVVFQLFNEVVPVMVGNFRELCTGQNSFGYEGSLIQQAIPSFVTQAGIFTVDGVMETGAQLIYGSKFEGVSQSQIWCEMVCAEDVQDENFDRGHEKVGMLSMVNMA